MEPRKASIADRIHSCLESFNTLTRTLKVHIKEHGEDLSLLAVEDQIGRFRLWAGNIGALQEGRSSLDYRLRDAQFVAENVLRLLDSLQKSVIGATAAAGHPATAQEKSENGNRSLPSDYETSSESSGASDLKAPTRSELAGYYLDITEIVGRLFKLSIAIRSPSIQNAVARSASFVEKDEDGNDLSALFEDYVLQRITHHYPELSPKIAERLSRAVGRRRRQFMYQRRHREKLGRVRRGVDNSTNPAQNMNSDNLQSSISHDVAVDTSQPQFATEPEPTVFHRSILSETTATQYVSRPEQPQAPSTKSFSTASGIFQGSEIDIPPPISPDKDQEFECPYCFFILSGEFKEQRTWRKHIFNDLEPYSCLFEDCPTPDQKFNNFNEWVYHEDWSHNLLWCCDLLPHKLQLFDSQRELEHHLQDVHNEDVNEASLRQLIERNRRPAPILWTECPFCKFVPDLGHVGDVSAGFSQDELASKKIIKHIGHHLQAISILALPWRDDLKDGADSELNESSKARGRETSSQLDASDIEKVHQHDESEYELDLRAIPSTDDQRWDMDPAGFQEVDHDDPIIQHLIFNQTDQLGRHEDHFAPLNPGEIRVLRIRPGKPEEAIHCDRIVVSLQSPPAYEYLSFSWLQKSGQMSITVGRESCNVTANLYSALMAIRGQDSPLTIWVDALCINYVDADESLSQVLLMPKISRNASGTIVWLGESRENSDLAMSFVDDYMNNIGKLDRERILAVDGALISLFRRIWWTRVWMVQEIIMSRSVVVLCGSRSTAFENFVRLRNLQLPRELYPDYQSVMQTVKEMPLGDLLLIWDQLRSEVLNGTAALFSIMVATRKLGCINPLDKVYAPLGLCRENNELITFDYMKGPREVYIEVMQYFLSNYDVLPLYIVEEHLPTKIVGLPSWVIDWSAPVVSRVGFAFDGRGARRAYRAGVPRGDKMTFRIGRMLDYDENRIFYEGLKVDTITKVVESVELAGADISTLVFCCRKWWSMYLASLSNLSRNSPSSRERFWRTLVANRMEDFVEVPTTAFLHDFKRWLGGGEGLSSLIHSKDQNNRPDEQVEALIRRSCESRKFAVTHEGFPALVPKGAQLGDHIVVLMGGSVPFVMRKTSDLYTIVGEAYVDGFMEGEALMALEDGTRKLENFSIC